MRLPKLKSEPALRLYYASDIHGTEVLRTLRADKLQNGTPVVALSASAMPEAVDAALAAGAAEYWTKPLNLSRLAADLRRFLRVVAPPA